MLDNANQQCISGELVDDSGPYNQLNMGTGVTVD